MFRSTTWLGLLAVGLSAAVGCQADLRPEALAERVQPKEEQRARALLERAAAAQLTSSAKPWASLAGAEVDVHDEFFGLTGFFGRPWPSNPCELNFRFLPTKDGGVVRFEDGTRWGLHEWNTWQQEPGEPLDYDDDDTISFWLPTLQYFLEMGFRVREGQFVDVAGESEVHGRPCTRVYVTWGSYEPHDTIDQYLVHLDDETGRLVRSDFTVRDVAGFVTGTALYSDFREVGGYLLPHRIEIGSDPPEDLLHRITIKRWAVGVDLPREEVAPDPKRAPRKKP